MNMKDMTVAQLNQITASSQPAPGGGSISAMAGAYAAALVCMVSKLTVGKKGYEDVQEQMADLERQAEPLRQDLLEDIQKDTESFNAYMEALALPKETEDEKAVRRAAMQEALKGASQVPLKVARKCLEILKLAAVAVELGNINTASDGMVGVLMARAATLGAVNNVLINLGGIKDEGFVSQMQAACDELSQQANALEAQAQATLSKR